jgi:hypothetical protein
VRGERLGTTLKTVTFDNGKILRVSKDGFDYLDDEGRRCSVEFHICRENFKKEMHYPEWAAARDPYYVAVRDIEAKPPHITFSTNPPTRFEFPLVRRDFTEFQMRLFYEGGVKTFDIT